MNQAIGAAQPRGRYGLLLALLYSISMIFFAGLATYEWRLIEGNIDAIARERGRALFDLIELTRDWNAQHGGVYVPVTPSTQPNEYLKHPLRDQRTVEGRELTMINPAFMTRQIAELAEQATGVRFHITSLKPMRPANAADQWETETLRLFETGALSERISFVEHYAFGGNTRPAHRFMAPLLVKPACMKCHEAQGYKVGDIRGGISVTMPAEDLLAVRDRQVRSSLLIMLASFIVLSALLHLLVSRAQRHYAHLQQLSLAQEGIIAERTRELELRNAELRREVDERRRREHELQLAAAVFDNAAEGIMVTDANNRIVRVNPAFTAITGYAPSEVMGLDPRLLNSGRHGKEFFAALWDALLSSGHWEGEIWNRRKNGDVYVAWLSITRIGDGEKDNGHYLAVFHDITRRKEVEEALRHKAHHDALTDLPNRTLFYDRLETALNQSRRYHRRFALLMVDLDRFKEVNDTLGHGAGDELLIEAAQRLTSCVRESDTVARLGGDEFALIVTDISSDAEVEQVARRAVDLLAEPYHLDAGTVNISGCIGIALYPQHGQEIDQLQRNADLALYAAKDAGRNAYRVYSPHQQQDNLQGDLL